MGDKDKKNSKGDIDEDEASKVPEESGALAFGWVTSAIAAAVLINF